MVAIAIFGPFFLPVRTDQRAVPGDSSASGSTTRRPTWAARRFTPGTCSATTGSLAASTCSTLVVNGARLSLLDRHRRSQSFAAILGTIVGGIAGYFGGWLDTLLMRIVDVLLSLPLLFVIIVVREGASAYGDWRVILHRLRLARLAGDRPAGPQPVPDAPDGGLRGRRAGRRA